MLWAIIVGLIVGVVAKLLVPGKDPGGMIVTILLGIAGSIIARWIGIQAGWYGHDEAAGFVASVIGAVLLLLAYRAIVSRRGTITR